MTQYHIVSNPWKKKTLPHRILAIRFQALGDTVITLPYLNDLKHKYPKMEIDFLTREEVSAIPACVKLFRKVINIGGGRNAKLQFILLLLKMPRLIAEKYDAVIDLQNNKISRVARYLLFPEAFSEFDRLSPRSAGERTRLTISALGLGEVECNTAFQFHRALNFEGLINRNKINIVLNPAGYSPSRNWPLENYVALADLWRRRLNEKFNFILLLMPARKKVADYLRKEIGDQCVDLTGKAGQAEAFQIIAQCSLVVSEDSGLMHMAWVQGIPTVALFSSSRKDWSSPQGPKSVCLDSSDLECGPCQLEVCKFGDNRCLTRYTPQQVFQIGQELLNIQE
jgi:heptosyltransferase-2